MKELLLSHNRTRRCPFQEVQIFLGQQIDLKTSPRELDLLLQTQGLCRKSKENRCRVVARGHKNHLNQPARKEEGEEQEEK